jgi:hypothetical protein
MLENCLSGSEGGGAIALPTPIIAFRSVERNFAAAASWQPRTDH